MSLLIIAPTCMVAEVLVLSAGYKLLRPRDYIAAVHSYRRLHGLSPGLRSRLAWAAPVAEFATAVLIMVPATRLVGLAAACAAFLVFYVVVGGDDRPVIANCGCWGRASFGVSRRVLLGRNLALVAIAAGALTGTAFAGPLASRDILEVFVALGMMLPFAFLILEIPELLMLAKIQPDRYEIESSHRPQP